MKNFVEIGSEISENSTLIIDVDGTLVADKKKEIDLKIIEKIKELARNNKVYLCSNSSKENAKNFAEMANVPILVGKKPFFIKIPEIIKKTSGVIVLGDKYLTDGIFAKIIGGKFIKIKRIISNDDTFFIKASYFFDDIVYKILPYLRLMRPWQWIKNILVFAPLFFAVDALNLSLFTKTLEAFLVFCFAASSVYVINDIFDYEGDKIHQRKKDRPIASDSVSKNNATVLAVFLAAITVFWIYHAPSIIVPVSLYIIVNIFYSSYLKKIAVLDITLISVFYILRIIAGGLVTGIYISPWIVACVFFGSLFVIIGKRKAESVLENRRLVFNQYSNEALNFMLGISASLAIMSYGIWSIMGHNSPYLVYSTVFVVFALFRILNHIYTGSYESETPEILVFKDFWILASFLGWLAYTFWVFYLA
jgi:decaprenyl-phosphate phosphoribosyltransferase